MNKQNKLVPARVNPVLVHSSERRRSLSGEWRFGLDPHDGGVQQGWFADPNVLTEKIQVPGCWQGQGFGHAGKDRIWDFQLSDQVFRATYEGTGWYGKLFSLPDDWRGQRIWLNFGGVHPSAEIWLNGKQLGSHSGPFIPFAFDITNLVHFPENLLTVRVYEENRWLGFAYNWQGHWSGLYRSVELTATGKYWLEKAWIYGDVDAEALRFRVKIGGQKETPSQVTLRISVKPIGGKEAASQELELESGQEKVFALPISSPLLWSPDHPNLYQVDAVLVGGDEVLDAISERAGFVKLSTEGKHFLINSEPYYMRGSGDFAINPETGSPDTDREHWRKKLRVLRDYGYNYVRCQSYVPTPEYYDAADEVGLLVQGEMGMLGAWAGSSPWHIYSWPQPSPQYRQTLKWQWDYVVMRDVNHPSAAIYCMSNELSFTPYPQTAWQCYRDTKKIKPGVFVIWSDGTHYAVPPNIFRKRKLPEDFINAEASIDNKYSQPVIQHEFRWWSSYPDIRIKEKYRGAIRPYVIERAEEVAAKNNLSHLLPLMAKNSQRLQYVEARSKLEACRRDYPRLAGICHFNATDAGFSPQGVLDEFSEPKFVGATTWRRTWGDTVVLIDRDFADRNLTAGEVLDCTFFISDFAHPPLKHPVLEWEFSFGNNQRLSGELIFSHRPCRTCRAGKIEVKIPDISHPQSAKLRATLREGSRSYSNEWNFWLFPKKVELPSPIAVYRSPETTWLRGLKDIQRVNASGLRNPGAPRAVFSELVDEALVEYMRTGGRVILAGDEGLVRPFFPKLGLTIGRYFFLPPANYPPFEDGSCGTIINAHPMLGDFPHEGFADLQFYRLIAESPPLDLWPFRDCSSEPVIRALSAYYVCYPLAYLMEFAVGKGGLIISSLNLTQKWPEARYLLAQILRYATSDQFQPKDNLSPSALQSILSAGALLGESNRRSKLWPNVRQR